MYRMCSEFLAYPYMQSTRDSASLTQTPNPILVHLLTVSRVPNRIRVEVFNQNGGAVY